MLSILMNVKSTHCWLSCSVRCILRSVLFSVNDSDVVTVLYLNIHENQRKICFLLLLLPLKLNDYA